jgi:acyl-CoA thioesterase II
VGDLAKDTEVRELGDGRYSARLSSDWAIWGPNGGYVASVALRAAGMACGRARPASVVAHYLAVADFDDVELTTTVLRRSRVATSVRVALHQGDRPVLEALVWGVDDGDPADHLVHEVVTKPEVPPPGEVLSFDERVAQGTAESRYVFWDNIEMRPVTWWDEFPPDGPQEPTSLWWWRFRPTARFDEPWLDACRQLIPVDTMGWPAAHGPHAHREPLEVIAPTVDLSVRFHQAPAPDDDSWLLCEAFSPVAAGGLMNATGRVWSSSGALLASGGQSLLCRRVPTTPPPSARPAPSAPSTPSAPQDSSA